jgi:hypothetical protein
MQQATRPKVRPPSLVQSLALLLVFLIPAAFLVGSRLPEPTLTLMPLECGDLTLEILDFSLPPK